MRLRHLIHEAFGPAVAERAAALTDVEVTGVAQDAEQVVPGHVFVARRGARTDGHAFAARAVERGAVLVVGARRDPDPLPGLAVPYLAVEDDRAAVAKLAAAYHDHPSRRLQVVGVTGTDGKTTTAALLWWLLCAERPAALLSTAMSRLGGDEAPAEGHFTTPEAPEVQAHLAEAARRGLDRVVLESSSHGLAWRRLDEVVYRMSVWTNLSPEHLDFHGSLEAYREAKLMLVRRAPQAVLNRDDAEFPAFARAAAEVVSYGAHPAADWRLAGVEPRPAGSRLGIARGSRRLEADLPLPGTFNALNALAALAAAARLGLDPEASAERLASFPGVPGRMQVVQAEPFALVVDFAHTAPALEKALAAVRPGAARVIVVIGAAGERDPGKRAPLGAAAARGADLAFFTEEDARSEDPEAILAEMAAGAEAAGAREGERFRRVPDRRAAIRAAVAAADRGDVVLLCGKGHERTLERAHETVRWDEVTEARDALSSLREA